MQPQTRIAVLAVALAFALGACAVYSPEIRQGNFLDNGKFAQVKPGMTREQVRFLLGPPMIADPFHRAQWDYYFSLENQYVKAGLVRRHFVVRFDGDLVASVEEVR